MHIDLSFLGYNRMVDIPDAADLPTESAQRVPELDMQYNPDKDVAGHILRWWFASRRHKSLFLVGPTGCGKTSLVEYICHHLNTPLFTVQVNSTMRAEDAEGGMTLDNGQTKFNYSDIIKAYAHGGVLMLDEGNRADPSLMTWLNAITEYRPITVFATGKTVHPHPDFKLIMTGNAKAAGDMSGAYIDNNPFCVSFANRFRTLEFDYPDADTEAGIIHAYGPDLPEALKDQVLNLSQRLIHVSRDGDDSGRQVSVPWTLRSVVDWVDAMNNEYFDRPMSESFAVTYTNALSETAEVEAVNDVVTLVFGAGGIDGNPGEFTAEQPDEPVEPVPAAGRRIQNITYMRHDDRNGNGPAYWVCVFGFDESDRALYMAAYNKEGEKPNITGKVLRNADSVLELMDHKVDEKLGKGYFRSDSDDMPDDLRKHVIKAFNDGRRFR